MITVKGHGMITAKGVRAGMNPAPTPQADIADIRRIFVRSRLLLRFLFIFLPFGLHSVNTYKEEKMP